MLSEKAPQELQSAHLIADRFREPPEAKEINANDE